MANIPTWLPVVALALRDPQGRLLLQKRPDHKHHGGCWEFPGGKVESGETPRVALVREIHEELGLSLDQAQLEPGPFAEEVSESHVVLNLYTSTQPCGKPVGHDGQEWGWFTMNDALALDLAPMDRNLLERIQD